MRRVMFGMAIAVAIVSSGCGDNKGDEMGISAATSKKGEPDKASAPPVAAKPAPPVAAKPAPAAPVPQATAPGAPTPAPSPPAAGTTAPPPDDNEDTEEGGSPDPPEMIAELERQAKRERAAKAAAANTEDKEEGGSPDPPEMIAELERQAARDRAAKKLDITGAWVDSEKGRCGFTIPRAHRSRTFRVRLDCEGRTGSYRARWKDRKRTRFVISTRPTLLVKISGKRLMVTATHKRRLVAFKRGYPRPAKRNVTLTTTPRPDRSGKVYGTWISSSGNVFEIPRSGRSSFDIVATLKNGKRMLLRGRWVSGMVGTQFTYTQPGARWKGTGTFSGGRIHVKRTNGVVTWWRRHHRRSRAMKAAGVWRSTSGNRFTVPASRGAFNLIATPRRGKKKIYRARWVSGMVGVQFTYDRGKVTATYNARTRKLRVVPRGGRVQYWTRVR